LTNMAIMPPTSAPFMTDWIISSFPNSFSLLSFITYPMPRTKPAIVSIMPTSSTEIPNPYSPNGSACIASRHRVHGDVGKQLRRRDREPVRGDRKHRDYDGTHQYVDCRRMERGPLR